MICGNCGTENADGARFCQDCGASLESVTQPTQQTATPGIPSVNETMQAPVMNSQPMNNAGGNVPPVTNVQPSGNAGGSVPPVTNVQPSGNAGGSVPPTGSVKPAQAVPTAGTSVTPKKKSILPVILVIAGAVFVLFFVLVIGVVLILNAKPKINLDDYVTFEASGYDGYGTLTAKVDWYELELKYGKKLKYTNRAKKIIGESVSWMSPMETMKDSINVNLISAEKLSNGDKVDYTWYVDEDLTDCIKCKIKYSDDNYKVTELKEVESFDPFEGVELVFSGIAPNGDVNYTEYPQVDGLYFDIDKYNRISNGDVLTVTATYSWGSEQSYVEQYGKKPTSMTKTFTVTGLDEYVDSYDDLTEDFIAKLKSEATDTIYSYTASNYHSESTLTDLTYCGYILNTIKDTDSYFRNYNSLYMIFCGVVSDSEGAFTASKVYYPVAFTNLLNGAEGLSFDGNEGISGSCYLNDNRHYTNGYVNPLSCYIDLVDSNREAYTTVCGDGFEKYSTYENIVELSDISDTYKQTLFADAKDRVNSYIVNNYSDSSKAGELTIAGEYLLTAKTQGTDFANNNCYFVVCSAVVTNTKNKFAPTTVFFPVEYDGIVKLPGDEFMFNRLRGLVGSMNFPDSSFYTEGYTDGVEMYTKIVTANRDKYSYKISDGLKSFGE